MPVFEVANLGTGKLSVMPMPANHEELISLRELGVDCLVSLLEEDERHEVGLFDEVRACEQNGIRCILYPITDRETPRLSETVPFISGLWDLIYSGNHVVIHCRAGVGRTGIIASAILVNAGYSVGEAIHQVSWARGVLVPDTEEQRKWVEQFELVKDRWNAKENFIKKLNDQRKYCPFQWADFQRHVQAAAEKNFDGVLHCQLPNSLILGGSGNSPAVKNERLSEQLDWAIDHYCYDEAMEFLTSLPEDSWDTCEAVAWNRSIPAIGE